MRGSELTLDPNSFLVLHKFSRQRVNWTRIHLLGKREWIRLRLKLRIGHRMNEVKYSKTEDSNSRKQVNHLEYGSVEVVRDKPKEDRPMGFPQ
jgi:hypothetical protein